MTQNNDGSVERANGIFAKFKQEHRHVTGGLQCYSELNEVEKQAAFKGIEFTVKHLMSQNEQQEVIGEVVNERGYSEVFVDFFDKPPPPNGTPLYTSPPKQIPGGWKLIGKVSEMGVVWHKQNPHAHPVGTEFYAVTPTNTEVWE